jgi:UDP-N-acetylmuramate: L-alanyl-gamma-D-glutamyl-meso-diaminopimelate ligase
LNENLRNDIRYQPYSVPQNSIVNGVTTVTLNNQSIGLSVFGNHNLQNLNAAYWACKELGISTEDFLKAIQHFTGASKRLELLAFNDKTNVYRDFAHAPSKVKATVQAVHQQFPNRRLIAVLELHTYSSLNNNLCKNTMVP